MTSLTRIKVVLVLAITLGILSLVGAIALVILWYTKLTPFQDFSVVVDAGSTHSKIFVYKWPADKSDGLGVTSRVNQVKACDVPGGAISSVTDPSDTTVRKYFDTAMTDCLSNIPSTRKGRAMIFLGATAGLRLIERNSPLYISNLLNATRAYFTTLGLHINSPESQVRIISGSEEGLSGWISTNILMRELYSNNKPLETYGVSDMGGASTQISFVAPNATDDRFVMDLFNTNYSIYSHSYLCYGAEQIRLIYLGQLAIETNGSLTIDEPCLQSGYIQNMNYSQLFTTACARDQYAPPSWLNQSSTFSFRGTGDSAACTIRVQARFNKTCSPGNCSWDNVYQPVPIPASLKFIAISAWYSTFNSLATQIPLQPNKDKNYDFTSTNLTQIKATITKVCNEPWSNINDTSPYRPFLCFNSKYHWTLFEYGYSMTDDNLKRFQIVKTIDSNDIGWTLGYMINQTNYLDPEYRPARLLTKDEFIGLLVMCILVFVVNVGVIIAAFTVYRRLQVYDAKTSFANPK